LSLDLRTRKKIGEKKKKNTKKKKSLSQGRSKKGKNTIPRKEQRERKPRRKATGGTKRVKIEARKIAGIGQRGRPGLRLKKECGKTDWGQSELTANRTGV